MPRETEEDGLAWPPRSCQAPEPEVSSQGSRCNDLCPEVLFCAPIRVDPEDSLDCGAIQRVESVPPLWRSPEGSLSVAGSGVSDRCRVGAIGLLAGLACLVPGPLPGSEVEGPERVVYHVTSSDPERQLLALRYVQDYIDGQGGHTPATLKVLLHGAGVRLLLDAHTDLDVRMTVDILRLQGVEFVVSGRSLRTQGLEIADLYEVGPEDRVESAILALMRMQRAGYAYIKP